jgi:hypothetical protein
MRAATRARCFLFLASCACACVTAGCVQPGEQAEDDQDPHQPGEALGFFSVTGKLGDDTCGAESLSAPATWSFQVKLSREGTTLYWLNGREAIVGDIDKSGSFAFETHLDLPLAEKHGAAKGCTIVRSDSASGALATSQDSLRGKLSYAYAATTDSDCSEFATGTSGLPLALPCSMTYALNGERVSE